MSASKKDMGHTGFLRRRIDWGSSWWRAICFSAEREVASGLLISAFALGLSNTINDPSYFAESYPSFLMRQANPGRGCACRRPSDSTSDPAPHLRADRVHISVTQHIYCNDYSSPKLTVSSVNPLEKSTELFPAVAALAPLQEYIETQHPGTPLFSP